jgi:hypothetical protein
MKTWQDPVQEVYSSLEELRAYNRIYNVVKRCGFRSAKSLWEADPIIGGSTDPKDFGIVKPNE